MTSPPNGLPRYRLLTGPDTEEFCRRLSEALDLGYQLFGSPCLTFDGERVVAGQAVLWPEPQARPGSGDENPASPDR